MRKHIFNPIIGNITTKFKINKMERMEKNMKIKNIKHVGRKSVYDINVDEAKHYVLENGVITHNSGPTYSSDNIWIVGRQQDKKGTDLQGYNFIIRIEKSRFLREGSKIPINVKFDGGISKYSGLLDVALDGGYVVKPKNGWYVAVDPKKYVAASGTGKTLIEAEGTLTKSVREADTFDESFWSVVFDNTDFRKYVQNKFQLVKDKPDEESIEEYTEA